MNKRTLRTLPSMARTAKAIEIYDAYNVKFCAAVDKGKRAVGLDKMVEKLDALAKAVGHAFGLDTADRNAMDTCENHIRPGPSVPGPGCELSFVRRMVALWKEGK